MRGRPLPHTPPLNLKTMLPVPFPGRPDAHHGAMMVGSRLGWFVTDPQGAAPGSSTKKGMDCQYVLHLNTFLSKHTLQIIREMC